MSAAVKCWDSLYMIAVVKQKFVFGMQWLRINVTHQILYNRGQLGHVLEEEQEVEEGEVEEGEGEGEEEVEEEEEEEEEEEDKDNEVGEEEKDLFKQNWKATGSIAYLIKINKSEACGRIQDSVVDMHNRNKMAAQGLGIFFLLIMYSLIMQAVLWGPNK